MRVTRKVFSIYSEDKLISAIEEKAFCEGYQAAQKEFAEEEDDNSGSSKRSKALGYGAIGTGAVALGAGGYAGIKRGIARNIIDSNIDVQTDGLPEEFKKQVKGEIKRKKNQFVNLASGGEKYENKLSKVLGESGWAENDVKALVDNSKSYKKAMNVGKKLGLAGGVLGAGYGVSKYLDKKKNKQ